MNFSEMLEAIKDPKYRATRLEWIPEEHIKDATCFIYLEPAKTIPAHIVREPQKSWLKGKPMEIVAHLVCFVNGNFFEWSPSNRDLMAQDWVIIVP